MTLCFVSALRCKNSVVSSGIGGVFTKALWLPAGKGLTSWLSFVISNFKGFFYFPIGILGQLWCLVVSIPDLCHISYFDNADSVI